MIDEKEARRIAEEHAVLFYRDLSKYKVRAALKGDNWVVDYNLDDPTMVGGGPHYIISAETGKIIQTRFEQ